MEVVEETQLLTKLAKTGLLSKAERAGVKLADLEPLLLFAEENGLVGLLGDLNDDLLPLLPLLVRLAPLGLPVLSLALGLGPLNFLLAIASFGGAFVVTGLPDDSVTDVALQTLIAKSGGVPPLIELVKKGKLEAQKHAARALWYLASNGEAAGLIAEAGGVAPLVTMLGIEDVKGQEFAAAAIARQG